MTRIIFAGGGTMGSVSPLLATVDTFKKTAHPVSLLWIGTKNGPERKAVQKVGIPYKVIKSGKFRRYMSLKNLTDPFFTLYGIIQSIFVILKFKPDVIVTAGSFVAVPVALAARLLRKKVCIHQQDAMQGLANKIMAKKADIITVAYKDFTNIFPNKKTIVTGNPVQEIMFSGEKNKAHEFFKTTKTYYQITAPSKSC